MKTANRFMIGFIALLVLQACAAFGVPSPKTFNERLATGYTTVTTIRQTATSLLTAGKITAADGANIQGQADTARAGLDVAKTLSATIPAAAEDKLQVTLIILQELQKYTLEKQK